MYMINNTSHITNIMPILYIVVYIVLKLSITKNILPYNSAKSTEF